MILEELHSIAILQVMQESVCGATLKNAALLAYPHSYFDDWGGVCRWLTRSD